MNRRRVLRTLGAGATASTLAVSALTGTAAAHNLTVEFRGCQEVLIVVNDPSEFGVLEETIHVFDADAGEVKQIDIELTRDNTGRLPESFGDRPVFGGRASGNDQIVAVETGDGRVFENPNDCPRPESLPKEVIVSSRNDEFREYTFEVTGDLEKLEPEEDTGIAVDEVSVRGDRTRVEGAVGTGDDRFAFSGELIEVDVPSDVMLEIRER